MLVTENDYYIYELSGLAVLFIGAGDIKPCWVNYNTSMALKRQRDDPNEYLGGDLVADFEEDEQDEGNGKKRLTKAERNEARKAANKKWKLVDRKVGSGIDPNPRHSIYYKAQIPDLADPEEWEKFQAALVDPLPVTFRIGGQCPQLVEKNLQKCMNNEFKTMRGRFVEINGVVLKDNIVKPISWAGKNVWQVPTKWYNHTT